MEFIGAHWYVWFLSLIIFGGYALYNQIRRMKGMMKGGLSGNVDQAFGSFFSGIAPMVVAGFLAGISAALLLISVIINVGTYFIHSQ